MSVTKDMSIIKDIIIALEFKAIDYYKISGKWPFWYDDAMAWLREQYEQNSPVLSNSLNTGKDKKYDKPADKVEPKFHVRDWVVTDKGYTVQIAAVNSCYTINNGMDFSTSYVDKYWHLWTITDAKEGDVLVCKGDIKDSNGIKYERICLFNNLDNAFFTLTKTSNYVETYDIDVNIDYPDNTVPATKEQKEILFIAMKEAGYKLDAESKQLLSLKAEPTAKNKYLELENDRIKKDLIEWIEDFPDSVWRGHLKKDIITWLEKQGKQKPKKVSIWKHWKDGIAGNGEGKQTYLIKNGLTYSISSCLGYECDYIELSELEELMREEKQDMPKWTEEDERHKNTIIRAIHGAGNITPIDGELAEKWLKSLKQRIVQ